ncbi:MAG: FHA domain-containing protein, partial [Undibacterium sp.]
ERSKGQTHETPIEKFPCVVGHSGNIAPILLNGTISNKHCTIRYDLESRSYSVEDGADGKSSSNGIYFDDGEKNQKVDRATLSKLGQKVYVLCLLSGEEGYIELYDPKKEAFCGRSTMDMDPRLVRTEAKAAEAHSIATQNTKHITELEGKIKQALLVFDLITANPLRTFIGILLILFALYGVMPFLLRDQIADFVLELERHKSPPEYRK